MAAEKAANSYDEIPYPSMAFPQMHPSRLAALGVLFGMPVPQLATCRVLELGCAGGTNLMSIAAGMPNARFVGVDYSSRQIAEAVATAEAAGLANVEFRHASIVDLDASWGEFDFILAHGVYSWVPKEVQESLLRVCKQNLAPNGIAFVSYNTYPGWHMRGMVRHMMHYHVAGFADLQERVTQARALLAFLAHGVSNQDDAYSRLLQTELDLLAGQHDSYLAHEHLEAENVPLYFHEFVAAADRHGLQYLAESDFSTMVPNRFDAETQEGLRRVGRNVVAMEQYMDFLRNRQFRQTLLVQGGVPLQRALTAESMQQLYVASFLQPDAQASAAAGAGAAVFVSKVGSRLTTHNPVSQLAFEILAGRAPVGMYFSELVGEVRARLAIEASATDIVNQLGSDLFLALANEQITIAVAPPAYAAKTGKVPVASPLARMQARRGDVKVVTLAQIFVDLDELARPLLVALDGASDRAALVGIVLGLIKSGVVRLDRNGVPVTDPSVLASAAEELLDRQLDLFAAAGLLMS